MTTNTASGKGSHGYMQNNHGNAGNGHRALQATNNHLSENHHGNSMAMNSSGALNDMKNNLGKLIFSMVYKIFLYNKNIVI